MCLPPFALLRGQPRQKSRRAVGNRLLSIKHVEVICTFGASLNWTESVTESAAHRLIDGSLLPTARRDFGLGWPRGNANGGKEAAIKDNELRIQFF